MPVKTKNTMSLAINGIVCDKCGSEHEKGTDDFHVEYTFGYGTEHDGDTVKFALCDPCLIKIVRENIPKAQWDDPYRCCY